MRTLKDTLDLVPVSVSVPTAARLLGVSVRKVWELIKNQEIASFHVGTRVLIPYNTLTSFVEQRLAAARGA